MLTRRVAWCGIVAAMTASAMAQGSAEVALEFMQHRDRLEASDVEGRMALGGWAQQRHLDFQASQLYREVLALSSDHEQAYERWVKIADTNELPEENGRVDELKKAFPGMSVHLTRHFIILFNTNEPWARNRAALLEKAHDVYFATFRRVGFRPLPLNERLVCVLYADHDDYLKYARDADNVEMGWSAGYFSTRTNRIVYFDDRDSPMFKDMVKKKQRLEQQADALRAQIKTASIERNHALVMELRQRLKPVNKQLTWYRNRHEAIAKLGNASKTVHEAVHQLVFNSSLQSPEVRYPLWISEGLATNFETDNPAKPFGPLHPNGYRRYAIQTHLEKGGELIALDEFVRLTRVPSEDAQQTQLIYNQAWALFGFVFRYHREELKAYLAAAMQLPPGERTATELHADFVKAFGQPRDMEEKFKNWISRLK